MKHQQVVPDYLAMLKSSCLCLALAAAGYVFLKLVQTIFWLPSYLEQSQRNLEKLAKNFNIDISKLDTEDLHDTIKEEDEGENNQNENENTKENKLQENEKQKEKEKKKN